MTAVVGILNKQGVAIAADSAVSMNIGGGTKIINRANKMFRISKSAPVGLMVYNLGEFLGTPWDVICKEYRAKREGIVLPTIENYKSDFIQYLKNEKRFHNPKSPSLLLSALTNFLGRLFTDQIREVQKTITSATDANPFDAFKKKIEQRLIKALNEEKEKQEFFEDFKDFTKEEFDKFDHLKFIDNLNNVVRTSLGFPKNFPLLDFSDLKEPILEYAFYLIKNKSSRLPFAGLVFVGFGEDEVFPALHPVNVMFMVDNRLQYCDDSDSVVKIAHDIPSCVAPFAQTDVMETLLNGASKPTVNLFARTFLKHLIKSNNELSELLKTINSEVAEKIRNIDSRAIVEKIVQDVESEQQKLLINPMMLAIASLSKEDLAEMAESLVYLTYLQRRFTFAPESVGGPVDVAIITKGDGFIWIKRKHYFLPELNQHFFRNY